MFDFLVSILSIHLPSVSLCCFIWNKKNILLFRQHNKHIYNKKHLRSERGTGYCSVLWRFFLTSLVFKKFVILYSYTSTGLHTAKRFYAYNNVLINLISYIVTYFSNAHIRKTVVRRVPWHFFHTNTQCCMKVLEERIYSSSN